MEAARDFLEQPRPDQLRQQIDRAHGAHDDDDDGAGLVEGEAGERRVCAESENPSGWQWLGVD